MKPSEWKKNKRVVIQANPDEAEEARRQLVKEELLEVVRKYIDENGEKDGKLKEGNLTRQEEKSNQKSRIQNAR